MPRIFDGQTTDVESEIFNIPGPDTPVQVLISGVLDGADVRTCVLDEKNNSGPIKPLSWRTSEGDTLPAPPLADGGLDTLGNCRIQFSIVNAGENTNINLSFSAKTV